MPLKIGELAKRAGCRVVTIRYYEREGLLAPPERSEGNYRLYGEEAVERLHFIRHCRLHGMNLAEIRELLAFRDRPGPNCAWINRLVERHIANVEAQIAELEHLKGHLRELLRACDGEKGAGCGILAHIDGEECACCKELHDRLGGLPEQTAARPGKTPRTRRRDPV